MKNACSRSNGTHTHTHLRLFVGMADALVCVFTCRCACLCVCVLEFERVVANVVRFCLSWWAHAREMPVVFAVGVCDRLYRAQAVAAG